MRTREQHLDKVRAENDKMASKMASIDPSLPAQINQLSTSFYQITLAEHILRHLANDEAVIEAKIAHAAWLNNMLKQTESELRQRMLTATGPVKL